MRAGYRLAFLLLVFPHVLSLHGQVTLSTATAPAPEITVPLPVASGALGRKDPAAMAEITSHVIAIGTVPWKGMQGTGKITFGPEASVSYDATLSNLGRYSFRLDAQSSHGPMSVRISHGLGSSRGGDGATRVIPGETALAGIFPFELLRGSHLSKDATSVLDRGVVNLDGTMVHRITLEVASVGRNPATKGQQTIAIDFYLDPTSHLLLKSATLSAQVQGQRAKLLDVVTYGDYRRVDDTLVPFHFTETLEGEQAMSLQLSDVQLNPILNATYFEF